jgi:hypothetical protein
MHPIGLSIFILLWMLYGFMVIRMWTHIRTSRDQYDEDKIETFVNAYLIRHNINDPKQVNLRRLKIAYVIKKVSHTIAILMVFIGLIFLHTYAIPKGSKPLEYDGLMFAIMPAFLVMITMIGYVIYPISYKSLDISNFIYLTKDKIIINGDRIHELNFDAKIVHKLGFWTFTLLFPFFIMGFLTTGYYNETEVVYRGYFSFQTEVYKYDALVEVNRHFKDHRGKTTSVRYHITNQAGQTLDILNDGFYDQTVEIHQYITASNPNVINPWTITQSNQNYIKEKTAPIQAQIYEIFD